MDVEWSHLLSDQSATITIRSESKDEIAKMLILKDFVFSCPGDFLKRIVDAIAVYERKKGVK